jgi:hypothetical protein
MILLFGSENRACLAEAFSGAFGTVVDAKKIRLPARAAHASYRPPQGADSALVRAEDFGLLYGAPLVEQVRVVSGWLLLDFSPAFFSALVEQINGELPLPANDGGSHAINRMLTLARHAGSGCPDHPAFHRALLLGIAAEESSAAFRRASQAAETLFHAIPPKERPALFPICGAFGGAMAKLLAASR